MKNIFSYSNGRLWRITKKGKELVSLTPNFFKDLVPILNNHHNTKRSIWLVLCDALLIIATIAIILGAFGMIFFKLFPDDIDNFIYLLRR